MDREQLVDDEADEDRALDSRYPALRRILHVSNLIP